MVKDAIITASSKIECLPRGITKITPTKAGVTLEEARKDFKAISIMNGGRPALILNDFRGAKIVSVDRDVREYMAGEKVTAKIKAFAVLVNSPVGKSFINFWLRINRPVYPSKVFTHEQDAVEWLLEIAD